MNNPLTSPSKNYIFKHKDVNIQVINRFYDYINPDGGYTGLDLGPERKHITKIRYSPYLISPDLMVGGKFQGSNSSPTEGYEDLHTITSLPLIGWNEVILDCPQTYRYVRYYGPPDSYCTVGRLEFYTMAPDEEDLTEIRLTGTPFGAVPPRTPGQDYFNVFIEEKDIYLSYKNFAHQTGLPFYICSDNIQAGFFHQHDFLECLYVYSGTGFHLYRNRVTPLVAGDMIVIPPETDHRYFGGDNLIVFNLLIYPDLLPATVRNLLGELPGFESFFAETPRFQTVHENSDRLHLPYRVQKAIDPYLRTLDHWFFEKTTYHKIGAYTALFQLFTQLSLWLNITESTFDQNDQILSEAITFIDTYHAGMKVINEVCDHLQIFPEQLSASFIQEIGMSPEEYLLRSRVSQACCQLIETKEKPVDIAKTVGYVNESEFSPTFQLLTGYSPLEFRKANQKR